MEYEKLKKNHLLLIDNYQKQETFINDLFSECLPVCAEIVQAKGIFKVFKIFKLAVYMAKFLIDLFDKKPKKMDEIIFY